MLLRAPALGAATLRAAVARHGSAVGALSALRRQPLSSTLDPATRAWLDAPDVDRLHADAEWLADEHHHLFGWDDADYPSLLREIGGAPAALFVVGDPTLLWMPQMAIVGSRSASESGLAITRRFARTLVTAGFTITSGLADGIDGAAHTAALDAGGRTLAVLGTGADLVYPRKHKALAARIAESGALVSEFPPSTTARPDHFPRRNRIISGLSLGTLVVEASLKSGSLITARYASEQGRDVFAVPGSINNPLARGCHQLIRDGAKLVETAEEIVTDLVAAAASMGERLRARIDEDGPAPTPDPVQAAAPARDAQYQHLLSALEHEPQALDVLATRTGIAVASLSSMLLVLELEGEVVAARGGMYVRRHDA